VVRTPTYQTPPGKASIDGYVDVRETGPGTSEATVGIGSGGRTVTSVAADETTAKLRLLLVDTCLHFARAAGYKRITLWTNDILVSARRIYEATGFQLVNQKLHHSFGHDLVGQNWARDL
jgi:hypothetical protein